MKTPAAQAAVKCRAHLSEDQLGIAKTITSEFYGELPVPDTWTDCRHTRTGWCGVRASDGTVVNIQYDPAVRPPIRARMPPGNYVILFENGQRVGAVLLERRQRRSSAPN
jgi:hypothetical protein